MKGRAISSGKAEGDALVLRDDFSFLGGVDTATGDLRVEREANMKDRVLVFPRGRGSTVGSFTMYDLKVKGNAPVAIVNREAETIVATGAVISSLPMVDRVDVSLIRDGDRVMVDGKEGTLSFPGLSERSVATSIIVRGGRSLMLHRSESMSMFPSIWGGVSGTMEEGESPLDTARREIGEETGLEVGEPLARGKTVCIRSGDVVWSVHPFLFRLDKGDPVLNWENDAYGWMDEAEIRALDTVPGLIGMFDDLGVWRK